MNHTAPLLFAGSPQGDEKGVDPDVTQGDGADLALARGDNGADLALVQRCARDDAAAMRELVRRYESKLTRYLVPLLGAREDAEEAVLDVFLRVWRDAHRFESRSSVSTWIYRIATNIAYDRLRRQTAIRRQAPPAELTDTVTADAEAAALGNLEACDRARLLDNCLRQMSVRDRLLLTLHYGEEMDYDKISGIVQLPKPLLRVQMMRARRRLREAMDAGELKVKE